MKKFLIALSALGLVSCASIPEKQEYVVGVEFWLSSSPGGWFKFDEVTASSPHEAMEKSKQKLLATNSKYEIKIRQVCPKTGPQVCLKF